MFCAKSWHSSFLNFFQVALNLTKFLFESQIIPAAFIFHLNNYLKFHPNVKPNATGVILAFLSVLYKPFAFLLALDVGLYPT